MPYILNVPVHFFSQTNSPINSQFTPTPYAPVVCSNLLQIVSKFLDVIGCDIGIPAQSISCFLRCSQALP